VTDVPTQAEGNEMPVFDLSGISDLQNIPGGTTVTFRLYGWAGGGNTGTASSNTVALGRENPDQVGGPLLTGSVIVDPNLGDDLPLLIVSEMGETVPAAGIHFFPKGTEITVTAEPVTEGVDVRYAPIGWSGSGSVTGGEGNAVTFT